MIALAGTRLRFPWTGISFLSPSSAATAVDAESRMSFVTNVVVTLVRRMQILASSLAQRKRFFQPWKIGGDERRDFRSTVADLAPTSTLKQTTSVAQSSGTCSRRRVRL
jgi:hypothetical protein